MNYQLFDVVVLGQDIPGEGVKAGAKGVVVELLDSLENVYLVEFCDGKGETIALIQLGESQLTIPAMRKAA